MQKRRNNDEREKSTNIDNPLWSKRLNGHTRPGGGPTATLFAGEWVEEVRHFGRAASSKTTNSRGSIG